MVFNIMDVKNSRLNYLCELAEELQDSITVNMHFNVNISEHIEDKELKTALISFKLFLFKGKPEETKFEDEDKEDEFSSEVEDREKNDGYYIADYKIWFRTDLEDRDKLETELLRHLEPYIKKGILDFSVQVGLPTFSLPYEFWKNVKKL
ncbi:hypothetical protein FQ085_00720 [Planococcus sp. ANT_H30]|uniref:hypothetical protein n=1 Tax=Planococcus sp. ANT_H30 TaxID=2597347 RepID=UPI0011EE5FA1|nr:hypothetical protein [Planococcus sp. ANT_H30]KAA0958268.1 hypothetical protein FQ085_00720 [Planococcus sp. ANT_H30]